MATSGSLVSLKIEHDTALKTFLSEFDAAPDELHGYFCGRDWPVERACAALAGWARGEGLQEGWVSCSTWFWEVDGALAGVINVRHTLTTQLQEVGGHIGYCVAPSWRRAGVATAMLSAVLPHCRVLGIERALLTCDADNVGSWKTIESCGGVLEREAWRAASQRRQRWYRIALGSD